MLQNLHVKNLALITETEVEFKEGLNILTGETGAGKSIIIGSVALALGEKVPKELLRDNEETALVELVFSVENPKVLDAIRQLGIETEDETVILSRKITSGRAIARINGEANRAALKLTVRSYSPEPRSVTDFHPSLRQRRAASADVISCSRTLRRYRSQPE